MELLNIPIIKDLYFKLYRNDLDKIKIIMPKPEIEYYHSNSNISNVDEEFINDLELFKKIIIKNINRKYLNTFYKNLDNLTITRDNIKKERNQLLEVKGCYYHEDNKIILSNNNKPDTIFHELFHVASSIKKNGNSYSGFNQYFFYKGKWVCIAEGINEGYTQVLTERYFPHKKEKLSSYPFEKEVVLHLENVVGKKRFQELYFTNDLEGLINELKIYTDNYQDIDNLILKLDYINKHLYNRVSIEELIKIKLYIKEVSLILIKIKANKLMIDFNNNHISSKELNKSLINYIKTLNKSIKVGFNKYYYLDIKEIEDYLNDNVKIKKI